METFRVKNGFPNGGDRTTDELSVTSPNKMALRIEKKSGSCTHSSTPCSPTVRSTSACADHPLRNSRNSPVQPARITSPVPISRLKLVSPTPQYDNPINGYTESRQPVSGKKTCGNRQNLTITPYHANPTVYPRKGQRTPRFNGDMMPTLTEEHRWTWRLHEKDSSGRISDRVKDTVLCRTARVENGRTLMSSSENVVWREAPKQGRMGKPDQ